MFCMHYIYVLLLPVSHAVNLYLVAKHPEHKHPRVKGRVRYDIVEHHHFNGCRSVQECEGRVRKKFSSGCLRTSEKGLRGKKHLALLHDGWWLFFADGTPFTWWVGRSGDAHTYWAGAPPGSQQCGCAVHGDCVDPEHFCNCDSDLDDWYRHQTIYFQRKR